MEQFRGPIRRVLPDRTWTNLPLTHPIFHCVFPVVVTDINKLQVPSIQRWERSTRNESGRYGGWGARPGEWIARHACPRVAR